MIRSLVILLGVITFFACSQSDSNKLENERFESFSKYFIDELWKQYPTWASSAGYHQYDHVLPAPNELNRKLELAFAERMLDSLQSIDTSLLEASNKADAMLIKNHLEATQWSLTTLKSWQWNPSEYNVCGIIAEMINNQYDSLNTRLINVGKRLKQVPDYYQAAMRNIAQPTLEHTRLAIDQNLGGLSVFENDLPDALNISSLSPQEKADISQSAQKAAEAVRNYCEYLQNYNNPNPRNFRLGQELYQRKFQFDIQSDFSAEEIYSDALKHKAELHRKMFALTRDLWPKYKANEAMPADSLLAIRAMIDHLSLTHTSADSFQSDIEKQIPELEAFVKKKNLLFLDPSKPLVVRREPDYMSGVAGASISAPGPYDSLGNTYYNVGSLNGWSPEQAESYLREYNQWILQILNIHEAIPGHYTQLVYSNKAPSLIKSILGNGAMVEGWAVYTEKMMLENGYGNNSPEMWLMYYKWNLRTTCNTILDYAVHNLNMSEDQALDLLMREAFQQKAEAQGKWNRVKLTQVQLCSYYTGFREICQLREAYEKREGSNFSLKNFHEKFLSYGSAPVPVIRSLMGL